MKDQFTEPIQPQRDVPIAPTAPQSAKTETYKPAVASSQTEELIAYPTIPGYEILDELGRGGMGIVYKATQLKLKRTVALKMMLRTGDLRRFFIEAEAIANIIHPNIVQIYDRGEQNGYPYFAMEFVSGGSLEEELGRSGLYDPPIAAQILEKIAKGVQAAHDKNIIHRDLKPHNILLDGKGEPKITDFGIAKLNTSDNLTQTGAVLGTLHYMAPEQADGKAKLVGPTADVYSLGVILYKCLTGKLPFHSDSYQELMWQIFTDPAKPLREINPNVPIELEAICLKCLHKDASKRYASAELFAQDLRQYRVGRTVDAQVERVRALVETPMIPASIYTPTSVAPKSNRRTFLIAGLFGTSVVAAGALWWWHGSSPNWEKIDPNPISLEGHTQNITCLRISKDNEQLVSGSEDGMIQFWDLAEAKVGPTRKSSHPILGFDLHPNGVHLATVGSDQSLTIWDSKTGTELRKINNDNGTFRCVAFSPDGFRLITGDSTGTIQLWDAQTGQLQHTLTGHGGSILAIMYYTSGSYLASASEDGTGKIWNLKSRKEWATLQGHTDGVTSIHLSDDDQIVTASKDKTVRIWTSRGKLFHTLKLHTDQVNSAIFSPDDRYVASGGKDQIIRIWNAVTGNELDSISPNHGAISCLTFTRDGSKLIAGFADGTIQIFQPTSS